MARSASTKEMSRGNEMKMPPTSSTGRFTRIER